MNFKYILKILILVVWMSTVITENSEESTAADETTEEATTEAVESTNEASGSHTGDHVSAASEQPTEYPKSTKKSKHDPKAEESCVPWPTTIRPLRECCQIPHNPLTVTLNTCYYRCTAREINENRQVECGAGCFVNVTGIFYNNHFNKERIKNLIIGAPVVPAKWIRIIENAVDSCRFEERSSMHDNLARFFACVNDFMIENCVQFTPSPECERTQELYEQCHHIKPICEHWPFGYAILETCCKIPPLFSQQLRSKCYHECTYSELFLQRQAKCDEICRYDDTKLRVNNRFNFDAVKALLMESAKHNREWKTPIEHAVEKCKSWMESFSTSTRTNTIDYEITALQTCLRESLANECIEFSDDSICRKVKTFMKNCPDIRPRKSTHHYAQYH